MRKTSQDGGDSTSITSGIDNELKKSGAIIKTKRNSIKRKVQNFSLESDEAVIEPLLQKDKEKSDIVKQSAKFNLLSKTKTDTSSEKGTDKDKLISDDKLQKTALSNASDVTDRSLPTSNLKENAMTKLTSANAPLHNHMNTNVFSNHDGLKTFVAPKSQILVEIDGSKHVGYNPSPLIFTTAKIHTDGKTKNNEPVQMTPVPILSTIEVSVMKSGIHPGETSGHVTSNISAVYIPQSNKKASEQDPKPPNKTVSNTTMPQNKIADTKIQILADKTDGNSNTIDKSSLASSSNKEIKLTQSNIATTSVKDNYIDNKSMKNKTETEDFHNKTYISQPNSSTSEKDKTVPHEAKFGVTSIASTNITNDSIKETKKDKPDSRSPEFKPDNLDLQIKKTSDNVNSLDTISKDKLKDSANTSFSSRQLQRQSTVLDKDDPISKLKPNRSPSIKNDSIGFIKSDESQKPSTIEINTTSDKTKLPKTSANSIPITSVTSVSTNNIVTDNKICASTANTAILNKKTAPTISNSAIKQTDAPVINPAVTNNTSVAISASASKSSYPIVANKTSGPTTTTSTVKNMSAANNKVAVSTTTAASINNTLASNTTAATVNKSSVPISTPLVANKTSAINIVTPNKISSLTTTASNKISFPASDIVGDNKLSSTSTTGNKISNTMSTTAVTDKMSSTSTTTAADSNISAPASTNIASSKLSNPITTTGKTNKIAVVTPTTNAISNKTPSSLPTTTTGNKIFTPSTTTTHSSKLSNPATTIATTYKVSAPSTTSVSSIKISATTSTTTADHKISSPTANILAGSKIPSTSTVPVTENKTSALSSSTIAGSKVSAPSITSTVSNKISSPSTTTTAPTKKTPGPVNTTAAIKITPGSTTTNTGVDKIFTSNSNSSEKPITSSSSILSQFPNTPITKSAAVTTSSASKNASTFGNIKPGISNETSVTKSQVTSTPNTKPTSITTTTKSAKVTTMVTPTTTSQRTTAVKPPTVTTAKSAPTTAIPAINKSSEITSKSSTGNEKPTTAKNNSTSICSTTTSGMSRVTSPASATSSILVSSGPSPKLAEANKKSDSKSKVIGNGSKSFKA